MRTIKFRAYDFTKKIMIPFEKIRPLDYVYDSDLDSMFYAMENHLHIMQYAGLKDKNGKEIYIDDLIDLGYCFGKVVFNESDFGAPCYCIEDIEGGFQPFFEKDDYTKIWFEVIGNIYENPELLS